MTGVTGLLGTFLILKQGDVCLVGGRGRSIAPRLEPAGPQLQRQGQGR